MQMEVGGGGRGRLMSTFHSGIIGMLHCYTQFLLLHFTHPKKRYVNLHTEITFGGPKFYMKNGKDLNMIETMLQCLHPKVYAINYIDLCARKYSIL